MNILKKSIAPITDKAWKEITEQASEIFKVYLTGRKFVDIDGPNGLEQGGISTGRLLVPGTQDNKGINYGIREVLPYVEIRKPFNLDLWELDNVDRGAKDIDLTSLEEAAKQVAMFEEKSIYSGFKEGQIKGLEESAEQSKIKLPQEPNEFLKAVSAQIINFKKEGVEGPYTLVLNNERWQELTSLAEGYPVIKQLGDIIKGKVIVNNGNKNSFLVSERGGDYELVLGQDISIGYSSHRTEYVELYFTESFTFRVLSPEAIKVFGKS